MTFVTKELFDEFSQRLIDLHKIDTEFMEYVLKRFNDLEDRISSGSPFNSERKLKMKFEEALQHMRNGKNVRRKEAYIRLHHTKNEFTNDNHQTIILTPHDLIKDDWELVE